MKRQSHSTSARHSRLRRVLLDCVYSAGAILRGYFGRLTNPRQKESSSSIVCDADLAAEKCILAKIRRAFPGHGIVAEESGFVAGQEDYTWVIDPLDGTSNFVAGLPWFGVQVGILRGGQAILAAMYLPLDQSLYFAERGQGATRNGRRIRVMRETRLANTLCAFGFDPYANPAWRRRNVELMFRISSAVRNTRATNCLVDFCYTADGRLGGCINLCTKIWDIVPVSLLLPEAGGRFTTLDGRSLLFRPGPASCQETYKILGASRQLHPKLLKLAGG